jgi:hypothetical protein
VVQPSGKKRAKNNETDQAGNYSKRFEFDYTSIYLLKDDE